MCGGWPLQSQLEQGVIDRQEDTAPGHSHWLTASPFTMFPTRPGFSRPSSGYQLHTLATKATGKGVYGVYESLLETCVIDLGTNPSSKWHSPFAAYGMNK